MFFKWSGSKRQICNEIIPYFDLRNFKGNYYEPFFGSGWVFYRLQLNKQQRAFLNDLNEEAINAHRCVGQFPEELMIELSTYKENHSKEFFYKKRECDRQEGWPQEFSDIERAARFVYLVQTGYNGLYRVNKKGEHNVPFGRYKNPKIFTRDEIDMASCVLNKTNVNYSSIDWFKSVEKAKNGDLVYLDPPYYGTFNSYTKEPWNDFVEFKRMKLFLEKCKKENIQCFVSNSLEAADYFKEFEIIKIKTKRSIAAKNSSRGEVEEILITNY